MSFFEEIQAERKAQEKFEELPDLLRWGKGIEGKPKGYPEGSEDVDGRFWSEKLNEDWQVAVARSGKSEKSEGYWFKWILRNATPDSPAQGQSVHLFYWMSPDNWEKGGRDKGKMTKDLDMMRKVLVEDLEVATLEELDAEDLMEALGNLSDVWEESQGRVLTGGVEAYAGTFTPPDQDEPIFYGPKFKVLHLSKSAADKGPVETPF